MIGDVAGARSLVDALEVRFLANRDDNLRFALLTDFLDGDAQVLPGDASVLDEARRGIDALNARHAGGEDVFFLLHRPRTWNPRERRWMGHERKRGKLRSEEHTSELQSLMRISYAVFCLKKKKTN